MIWGEFMSAQQKEYTLSSSLLWSAVGDVVELCKARVLSSNTTQMTIETEMYKIKTEHTIQITTMQQGALVTIATQGESDDDKRSIQLMFAALDNMLEPFLGSS
jgi:hypothetical protein